MSLMWFVLGVFIGMIGVIFTAYVVTRYRYEPLTILIVDDDVGLCDTLKSMFERVGYSTVVAHNGIEALACIHAKVPALIILDLKMDVQNGPDTLITIRKEYGPSLPVIIHTANSELMKIAVTHGSFLVWAKPTPPEIMLNNVRTILEDRT